MRITEIVIDVSFWNTRYDAINALTLADGIGLQVVRRAYGDLGMVRSLRSICYDRAGRMVVAAD